MLLCLVASDTLGYKPKKMGLCVVLTDLASGFHTGLTVYEVIRNMRLSTLTEMHLPQHILSVLGNSWSSFYLFAIQEVKLRASYWLLFFHCCDQILDKKQERRAHLGLQFEGMEPHGNEGRAAGV